MLGNGCNIVSSFNDSVIDIFLDVMLVDLHVMVLYSYIDECLKIAEENYSFLINFNLK